MAAYARFEYKSQGIRAPPVSPLILFFCQFSFLLPLYSCMCNRLYTYLSALPTRRHPLPARFCHGCTYMQYFCARVRESRAYPTGYINSRCKSLRRTPVIYTRVICIGRASRADEPRMLSRGVASRHTTLCLKYEPCELHSPFSQPSAGRKQRQRSRRRTICRQSGGACIITTFTSSSELFMAAKFPGYVHAPLRAPKDSGTRPSPVASASSKLAFPPLGSLEAVM